MEKRLFPSCKKKIEDNTNENSNCNLTTLTKNKAEISCNKTIIISVLIIITLLAYAKYYSEYNKPYSLDTPSGTQSAFVSGSAADDSVEKIHAETLKDMEGKEFTSRDVVQKLNSFLREEGADALSINDIVLEAGNAEDIYSEIKDNFSISIVSPKGRSTVTSVSVLAQSDKESYETFRTFCLGLMSIFTSTMRPEIRQRVLFNMMGYEDSGDITLYEGNTYIIAETKYIFAYSKQNGLSMFIEQMPKLEIYSGDLPIR
jgi:hypothetical protein